jgi:uncharacterized membrane protein
MSDSSDDKETLEMAEQLARMINKNISAVMSSITGNIDLEKIETVLAAFAGVYTVSQYYEYKLNKLNIPILAIQKSKEAAEKYFLDVISADLNSFKIEKGDA